MDIEYFTEHNNESLTEQQQDSLKPVEQTKLRPIYEIKTDPNIPSCNIPTKAATTSSISCIPSVSQSCLTDSVNCTLPVIECKQNDQAKANKILQLLKTQGYYIFKNLLSSDNIAKAKTHVVDT